MNRIFLAISFSVVVSAANAQAPNAKTAQPANKPAAAAPAQPVDTAYTESIIKNTTDKMFLTELVDHLPLSTTVPSPAKVLGYPIGTPNKLTYTADMYRYYRELEKASPRVRVFLAPGDDLLNAFDELPCFGFWNYSTNVSVTSRRFKSPQVQQGEQHDRHGRINRVHSPSHLYAA